MNYELAKELKEVGFPFVERYIETAVRGKYDRVYEPTLSELIEACGEEFQGLFRLEENNWVAGVDIDYSKGLFRLGKTPEEAVARLYIALNK